MAAMNDVPREILHTAYKRNPIYLLKAPLLAALWAGLGVAIWQTMNTSWAIPVGIACSLVIANIVRGLGSIAHDAVHGAVSKSKTLSYWIGLACWMPSGMSYTIYGNYHLHHHRITNTYPDVDNFVVTDYTRNPVLAKLLLLCIYSFAYPIYFMFQMFRYTKRLSAWQKVRMNLELAVFWGLVATAVVYLPGHFVFFVYGLPFILGSVLASTTSMIEHYEMDLTDDDAYSSRTYATDRRVLNFIWNNLGYHNEHHKYPGIPWYNLRSFHEAAKPYYDERIKAEIYGSFLPVIFMLWGRILKFDMDKAVSKYAHLDRDNDRQKHMELAGIPTGAPEVTA